MKLSTQIRHLGVYTTSKSELGTSLLRPLPNVKHANVKKHFGSSLATERGDKYSSAHVMEIAGVVVTLYMANGKWRFGAIQEKVTPYVEGVLANVEALLSA